MNMDRSPLVLFVTLVRFVRAMIARGEPSSMPITGRIKVCLVVAIAGPAGFVASLPAQQPAPGRSPETESRPVESAKTATKTGNSVHEVRPGKLAVSVTAGGVVRTSRTEYAYCKVEGTQTILWILPDESLVTKGQLIAELDPKPIRERLDEATFAERGAQANYQNAKLTREVAEISLREYTESKEGNDSKTVKELKDLVEKSRADEQAKEHTWKLAQIGIKKLGDQIARCQIFSPLDGLLEHANDKRRMNDVPSIGAGRTVRERQIIAFVHDLAGPMEVNAKVPAQLVPKVKRGLKSRVKIEALPGEEMTGTVKSVARLADPNDFLDRHERVHSAVVGIEKPTPRLRWGMAAEVEILVTELDNVLSVPIEAVVHFGNKDHLAVQKPGGAFEWREVSLGQSNKQVIEVKQGLNSGDVVAIQPQTVLSVPQVCTVTPGRLTLRAHERGVIEAARTTRGYARLKGDTVLSWILPEGSAVLVGQPVCQLDTDLDSCLIRASINGVVIHPPVEGRNGASSGWEPGAIVGAGRELFTIVDDTGPFYLNVKVQESVIDQLAPGLKARITLDARPQERFDGIVSDVAALPDPVCFFEPFTKTYTVKVQFDSVPKFARREMMATVEIVIAELENVLAVPARAVVRYDGKDHVAIAGKTEWREVTLGQANEQLAEIRSGIESGERILLDPPARAAGVPAPNPSSGVGQAFQPDGVSARPKTSGSKT